MQLFRASLRLAGLCAALIAFMCAAAFAQAYPDKPIRMLVGFSTGSSTDVTARLLAEEMGKSLGQRVVVENKPGASSNLATQTAAGADPDGYTLLMATVANTINTAIGKGGEFDFPKDFKPIALVGAVPMILTVNPKLGVKSVDELKALAAKKPDGLLYGSPGPGTAPHLSAELFGAAVGAKLVHVPYSGTGQAAQDLVAGRIDMMFAPASSVIAQIKAGNLIGLATTLSKRAAIAPDLPTIAESGIADYNSSVWFGLMAPGKTPDAVVKTLADAVNAALKSEVILSAFGKQGIEALGGTPDELSQYIEAEISRWSGVAEQAGVKAQ